MYLPHIHLLHLVLQPKLLNLLRHQNLQFQPKLQIHQQKQALAARLGKRNPLKAQYRQFQRVPVRLRNIRNPLQPHLVQVQQYQQFPANLQNPQLVRQVNQRFPAILLHVVHQHRHILHLVHLRNRLSALNLQKAPPKPQAAQVVLAIPL